MAFELAEIVAQLVQAIGTGGEVEAGENGVVDLLGGPAAHLGAAMQEDFEEADETGVVDLDPGIANRADGDREGQTAAAPASRAERSAFACPTARARGVKDGRSLTRHFALALRLRSGRGTISAVTLPPIQ